MNYLYLLHFCGGVLAVLNGISISKKKRYLSQIKMLEDKLKEKNKIIDGYELTLNRILKINGTNK